MRSLSIYFNTIKVKFHTIHTCFNLILYISILLLYVTHFWLYEIVLKLSGDIEETRDQDLGLGHLV